MSQHNDPDGVGMKCNFCGGPAHPATGCQYSENMISCYRCTVEAWSWVKHHTSAKAGRRRNKVPTARSFYESIVTPPKIESLFPQLPSLADIELAPAQLTAEMVAELSSSEPERTS